MNKYSKGFSVYFSIGKNKGFNKFVDGPYLRINAWWFSLCIGWFDLEAMIESLLRRINDLEKEVKNKSIEFDVLEVRKNELQKQLDEFESDRADIKETIDSLQKQKIKVQEFESKFEILHKGIEAYKKELNGKDDEEQDLLDRIDDLSAEITDLTDTNGENERLKVEAQLKIQELERQIESSNKQIENLKNQVLQLQKCLYPKGSSSSSSSSSSSF